jgi:hypothetical protein
MANKENNCKAKLFIDTDSEGLEEMLANNTYSPDMLNSILVELIQDKSALNMEQRIDKIKKIINISGADPNRISSTSGNIIIRTHYTDARVLPGQI